VSAVTRREHGRAQHLQEPTAAPDASPQNAARTPTRCLSFTDLLQRWPEQAGFL